MEFLSSCTSGGCGAKIGPGELGQLLKSLPAFYDDCLLVGFNKADDAAVYQMNESEALISTIDFFSPMVDDPYLFGKIAATNALSDVYAMGGNALFALNLICFPEKMDKAFLADMMRGGAEKIQEAGAVLAGGHSIYDSEVKYGLAVTGVTPPDKIIRNNTPIPGDVLILTKALGIGLIQSAARGNLASEQAKRAALSSMTRLNKQAAEKMKRYPVHACTDVTGFGLLVHAAEMAGSEYTLAIDSAELPLLPEVEEYAAAYLMTASGERNRQFLEHSVDLKHIKPAVQEILFDPQTSGGLLISVSAIHAQELLNELKKDDPVSCIIGEVGVRERAEPPILVF
ncbi:selenide, water dikinase SelD [Listeria sp. PSOL-1]|uniref:selenide, water dikinase SelD n=1 Tax=Listeria sp. PSOL-1 TaxID=1844999 RepID=UPI0013D833D2|nr:selenide, water dikinase SelD [Listeria sp. PSOL-1]